MRVLIINKFLYPNGGSETYIFKLGEALEQHGHEVQYFGMEHEGRCVGNRVNAYTSDMDFHGGSKLSKLTYPIKTIYSKEAREKLRLVLDDFKPDVCHLNNFNYQLTPSIILEIVKWRKETGRDCKIIFTAHVINNKPNGTNINNNAGSTHIEGLQKFVVEKGLDVGFAFDGDADRCLCVDEKGNVITGDHILYIYGCYMKERGKLLTNTVVTTVMSNFGLYKAFDEQGIGYAKTAVGDKYVYEYMAKNGCRIGGEQSGHIIFSKYASTGDGILTSLKMMEVMLAKKKPMSELAAPLKIYPQVLENVRVTDKKAAQNDPAVQEAVSKVAEALGDTGRILVRESGTEPVVRVMVEAPDHDTCQKYVDEVVNVICEKGYKV